MKDVYDLYIKTLKHFWEKWKTPKQTECFHVHQLEDSILFRWFDAISIKIPAGFSFVCFVCVFWRNKWAASTRIYNIQNDFDLKKYKLEGLTLCDFKIQYKAIEVKTIGYWHEDMHINRLTKIDQYTGTETVNWFSTQVPK